MVFIGFQFLGLFEACLWACARFKGLENLENSWFYRIPVLGL